MEPVEGLRRALKYFGTTLPVVLEENVSLKVKFKAIEVFHLFFDKCNNSHCKLCSILKCKNHNPLHLAKFGCPSCAPKQKEYKCVVCDINQVDPFSGFDTCEGCLNAE